MPAARSAITLAAQRNCWPLIATASIESIAAIERSDVLFLVVIDAPPSPLTSSIRNVSE